MRKRTISFTIDKIFWWGLAALPIIAYLIFLRGFSQTFDPSHSLNFGSFVEGFTLFSNDNIIFSSLFSLFNAEDGLIPVIDDLGLFHAMVWFIVVNLMHLMVDFILFIPRLAHKWMNVFTREDD